MASAQTDQQSNSIICSTSSKFDCFATSHSSRIAAKSTPHRCFIDCFEKVSYEEEEDLFIIILMLDVVCLRIKNFSLIFHARGPFLFVRSLAHSLSFYLSIFQSHHFSLTFDFLFPYHHSFDLHHCSRNPMPTKVNKDYLNKLVFFFIAVF